MTALQARSLLCLVTLAACSWGCGSPAAETLDAGKPSADVPQLDLGLDTAPLPDAPCTGANCCQVEADCPDDGDLCNGTPYCVTASHTCAIKPGSKVECSDSPGETCTVQKCEPKTGQCLAKPVSDGIVCSDDDTCTSGDQCKAGVCAPGTNTCECAKDDDCAKFEDANPCNGTLYCSATGCKVNPATVVTCPGNPGACHVRACEPKTGECATTVAADAAACDLDGLKCTADSCNKGVCLPGKPDAQCACLQDADCGPFEDANPCNGTLYCNKVKLVCQVNPATVVVCPDAGLDDCAQNSCDAKNGQCAKVARQDGEACDDHLGCTLGDHCKAGQCTYATSTCECKTSPDCAKFEDGNACNGMLYCDQALGLCHVNPATVVTCSGAGDTVCSQEKCVPASGKCAPSQVNEGLPCEADDTWCTSVDICTAGQCAPAPNGCPCQQDADCGAQEDGNACNGKLYCNKVTGLCKVNPATVVTCSTSADTGCVKNTCDAKTGACANKVLVDGTACAEDDFLCSVEACKGGQCQQVANSCLCWNDADCSPFEDANACNGTLFCDKTAGPPNCKVNPATLVTCPVATAPACQISGCVPATGACGFLKLADGVACDDGDGCSPKDACSNGACLPGAVTACDDSNPCTTDGCDKIEGCTHLAGNDGEKCDGGLCSAGLCVAPPKCLAVNCMDSNPCTTDACINDVCTHNAVADGATCGAKSDICLGGSCVLNVCEPADCDDGSGCTIDSCVLTVCQHQIAADGVSCGPGLFCNAGKCQAKACVPVDCSDDNSCTTDKCAGGVCQHTPKQDGDGDPCDDGSACTQAEYCAAGECGGGEPVDCGDEVLCTTDGCDPVKGCVNTEVKGCKTPLWQESFDTGTDPAKVGWELVNWKTGGPEFKIDGLPNPPGARSPGNSLNFNDNITLLYCANTQVKIDANANGPVIDATGAPANSTLKVVFWYAGTWQNGTSKSVRVTSTPGTSSPATQLLKLTSVDDLWRKKTVALGEEYVGKFRLGFGFLTNDCNNYNGNGLFVDDLQVFVVPPCLTGFECIDDDPCTEDGCDSVTSHCTHVASNDGVLCDDGVPCTTTDKCKSGVCEGVIKTCEDVSPCTTDTCEPSTGHCGHAVLNAGTPCSDGQACTSGDVCFNGGSCAGAVQPCVLANDNGCFLLKCDPTAGCKFPMVGNGVPCYGGTCANGVCVAPSAPAFCDTVKNCPEAVDACHIATCPAGKCAMQVDNVGGACDDLNACTNGETCQANGSCVGMEVVCDDGDPCTADGCDKAGGCTHTEVPGCFVFTDPLFEETFPCGGAVAAGWTATSIPGPAWDFDATPSLPPAVSGTCTLNLGDGNGVKCAIGQAKVSSSIVTPEIDASGLKPLAALRTSFWIVGDLLAGSFAVDRSIDNGQTWQSTQGIGNQPKWGHPTLDLSSIAGKKFLLRFSYNSGGCGLPAPKAVQIDDLRVFVAGCTKDADCADSNVCTTETCNAASECVTTENSLPCDDSDKCTGPDKCNAGKCSGKKTCT